MIRGFFYLLRPYRRLVIFALVYLFVGFGLTLTSLVLNQSYKSEVGLLQSVYVGSVSEGNLVSSQTGASIDLDIFDENPGLPGRFFTVTWTGFWHLSGDRVVDVFAGADDRVVIHIDDDLVLDRNITTGLHTVSRTVSLSRGLHLLNIQYEQYGGGYHLNVQWAPTGSGARPFDIETLFAQDPGESSLSIHQRLLEFEQLVGLFWIIPTILFVLFLLGPPLIRIARRTIPDYARKTKSFWDWFWRGGLNEAPSFLERTLVSQSGIGSLDRVRKKFYSVFIHAIFLFFSILYCSRFFILGNLNSHAIRDGDPALMNWTLQWVSRALISDPLNLFNGNAFHPFLNSVALTDHMFSLALINLPIGFFAHGPWFGYNILIFLSYYLSCIAGYRLIRELTGSRLVAVWAGIFWGFLFFRVHHIGHLQILSFQWIPFAILYLIKFLKNPSYRNSVAFSFFFVVQALVSWYLAVITSLIVTIVILFHFRMKYLTRQYAKAAVLALGICVISISPFVGPYVGAFEDTHLSRRLEVADSIGDATSLASYLLPPKATYLGQVREKNGKYAPWIWGERTLYVGYIPLFLSALCLTTFLFRKRTKAAKATELNQFSQWTQDHARWIVAAFILVLTGFVFSKGFMSYELGIRLPLYYLSEAVWFIKGMRAPQRFSLMLYFGVLVLSSFGLWVMVQRARQKLHEVLLVAGCCLIFLFEVYPYNLPITPAPYQVSHLDRLISRYQAQQDQLFSVLHLPIHHRPNGPYPMAEAVYMLDSTVHWARVVNGYSGSTPMGFIGNMGTLTTLPRPAAVAKLFELGIDLVAIHGSTPEKRRQELLGYFSQQTWARIFATPEGEYLVFIN